MGPWAKIREILGTTENRRISENRENGNEALAVSCDRCDLSSSESNKDEEGNRVKIFFLKVKQAGLAG